VRSASPFSAILPIELDMAQREPITIVLGEFEDLIARGLRGLLEEEGNFEIIAAGVDLDTMASVFAEHTPKLAILNFGSLRSPIEVNHLHQAHPDTRLLILASRPTAAECNQMLAFGATACLSKETEARDILTAVHLASRGLHVLPKNGAGPTAPMGPELLTPREADVLELLRQGRANAEIALALHISVETVRTHRRNIYRKLGVRTRRELAGLSAP
jgi:two-component system response regulator DesR